jgi:hypothetical protein
MTGAYTREDGQVAICIAVDHCSAECVGIHAAKQGTRFEALEPIRHGVCTYFRTFTQDIAQGLGLRHDHGSQYMSHVFQEELTFLGITSAPAFVREPRATAVPNAFFGRSRRISYGSKLLIPWKSGAWRCMHFSVNTMRPGLSGGMATKRLPRCDMRATVYLG